MDELLDLEELVLLDLEFSIDPGDLAAPVAGIFLGDATGNEHIEYGVLSQTLGARPDIARECLLERLRGAPGALEALGRYAQPIDTAHTRRLGVAQVVAIQIGGRVGHQHVQLHETSHQDFSISVAGCSSGSAGGAS